MDSLAESSERKANSGTDDELKPTPERRQIFQPALSIQRYQWVQKFLEKRDDIKSVTDVGCGNGRMLLWLKSISHLESIKLLDKDASELEPDFNSYIQPGLWDMIFGRKECANPLRVQVYHGDLTKPSEELQSDCFTLVEVIEHLEPQVVKQCCRVVFDYYRPKLVIVTTPNSEFNHLLRSQSNESTGTFRHSDHKFEWTRAEFREWCDSTIQQINNTYTYDLHGVGHLSHSEPFGPCTQIATFTRLNSEEDAQAISSQPSNSQTNEPHHSKDIERILNYEIPAAKHEITPPETNQDSTHINYETW